MIFFKIDYTFSPPAIHRFDGKKYESSHLNQGQPNSTIKFESIPLIILLTSMATLLPWNFFITPFAYWMMKFQRSDVVAIEDVEETATSTTPPITETSTLKFSSKIDILN